ncbi:TetR family transcriptional regulator C-terminal domain-containing protein [uncultured Arcticibacterium sp.]|uniref:TetR family transcriptional regulator C-terminal domain-containing protein n=1 Tax=uncultured Arcticibacterium sp. TaxID=2173042 RepID=UPI0030F918A9
MAKSKKSIIDLYMNWMLEHGSAPENIYIFCKENKMEESDFYAEYASFKAVEKAVFSAFFQKTLEMLHANEAYQSYAPKEQLLSFYFTFFELLTANRSYVLQALPSTPKELDKLGKLQDLRINFKAYAKEVFAQYISTDVKNLEKLKAQTFQETAWAQLLFIMRFWAKDESPSFEKTDIFIEKAINATFELADNPPLKSVIDLGKFLYKEAIS